MTTGLRILGAILPKWEGVDYRVIGRFHKIGGFSDQPIVCGNGFLMAGSTSNAGFVSGINERPLLQALSSMIQTGETVYNIGANVGYTALWLAKQAVTEKKLVSIVAFEPEPDNFVLLTDNISLNTSFDITCQNLAFGNLDGVIRMASNGSGDGSAHISKNGELEVDCLTLDTFVETKGPNPNWIYMDVEGFAAECLKGGKSLLETVRPKIALEVHSELEDTGVRDILESHGYKLFSAQSNIWGRFDFWKPEKGE